MSSHSDHHGSLWPPQQVFDQSQSQSQPQHPTNAYPYTADSVTYASGLTAPYAEGGPGPGSSSTYDPLSALPSSSQSSSPLGHGLPPSAMSYGIPSTSGDFSNHGIPRGTLTPSAIYSESTIISYGTGSAPTNGTVVQEIKGSQSIYRSAGYGPMNPHHQDDPYSYPDPRYAGAVDVYGHPTGPQVKMKRKQVKVACSNCQQASTCSSRGTTFLCPYIYLAVFSHQISLHRPQNAATKVDPVKGASTYIEKIPASMDHRRREAVERNIKRMLRLHSPFRPPQRPCRLAQTQTGEARKEAWAQNKLLDQDRSRELQRRRHEEAQIAMARCVMLVIVDVDLLSHVDGFFAFYPIPFAAHVLLLIRFPFTG
jgi:hypothetical protein